MLLLRRLVLRHLLIYPSRTNSLNNKSRTIITSFAFQRKRYGPEDSVDVIKEEFNEIISIGSYPIHIKPLQFCPATIDVHLTDPTSSTDYLYFGSHPLYTLHVGIGKRN